VPQPLHQIENRRNDRHPDGEPFPASKLTHHRRAIPPADLRSSRTLAGGDAIHLRPSNTKISCEGGATQSVADLVSFILLLGIT
jgi:hypothetical protein